VLPDGKRLIIEVVVPLDYNAVNTGVSEDSSSLIILVSTQRNDYFRKQGSKKIVIFFDVSFYSVSARASTE